MTSTIDLDQEIHINFADIKKSFNTRNVSILHTCITKIKGVTVKILIDGGADGTLITKSLADKLNLTQNDTDNVLTVQTFNGETKNSSVKNVIPIA